MRLEVYNQGTCKDWGSGVIRTEWEREKWKKRERQRKGERNESLQEVKIGLVFFTIILSQF